MSVKRSTQETLNAQFIISKDLMSHRTFPKEGQKKLNQLIRDLKAQIKQKDKELEFLRKEISNLTKPLNPKASKEVKAKKNLQTFETWRDDFLQRFKKEVLNGKD